MSLLDSCGQLSSRSLRSLVMDLKLSGKTGREERSVHPTPMKHPLGGTRMRISSKIKPYPVRLGNAFASIFENALVRSQGRTIIHSQGSGGKGVESGGTVGLAGHTLIQDSRFYLKTRRN